MQTLFTASHHTHILAVVLLILSQFYYFVIKNEKDFVQFSKKLGTLLLIQNIFLGLVIFTGLLMLGVMKFSVWNLEIVLMIFVTLGVVVHQILINKKRKPIKSDEYDLQEQYKNWIAKVYGAEISAEILVLILAPLLD